MSGLGGGGFNPFPSGGPGQTKETLDLGLGRRKPKLKDITVGFTGGGIRGKFKNNTVEVTANPQRQALVERLAGSLGIRADELDSLRARVAPGASEFRRAALNRIGINRERAVGNLRENLARRRVSGSSFALDAETRLRNEFATTEAEIAAQSTLQEIDILAQFSEQAGSLRTAEFQTLLSEQNFLATIGLDLQKSGASAISAASLAQQAAAVNTVNQIADFAKFGTGFASGGGAAGGAGGGFTQPTIVDGGRFAGQAGR